MDLWVVRTTGFASLPDELVARIMETAYAQYLSHIHGDYYYPDTMALQWTTLLSSVCKRFRHITLRLPALWGDIPNIFPEDTIRTLTARCHNPRVFVDGSGDMDVPHFISLLHPNSQWKGLDIYYLCDGIGRTVFDAMDEAVYQPFRNLASLSIDSEGGKEELEQTTLFSRSSDRVLSSWDLVNLTSLRIKNIIPSSMKVPRLKECRIGLERSEADGRPFAWDMQTLRRLFHSFQSITILSVSISNASSSTPGPAIAENPALMTNLTSFSLRVRPGVEPVVIRQLMDSLHMSNLRKMDIRMKYKSQRLSEPPVAGWLSALFREHTGKGRVYPKLEDFYIDVQDTEGIKLPYKHMLHAMPNIRHMSLSLPGCSTVPLVLRATPDCLHDLRSLRLNNCTSFHGPNSRIEAPHIEKLEVTGYTMMSDYGLRDRFGEGLVWNAMTYERE